MDKWSAICLSVLFVSIAAFNMLDEWQEKEVQKECFKAVTLGKADAKDCHKQWRN